MKIERPILRFGMFRRKSFVKRLFLSLFRILDEDWQVYIDLIELEEPKKPSMTLEQIAKLPSSSAKEVSSQEYGAYKNLLKEYDQGKYPKQLYDLAGVGESPLLSLYDSYK
jgi:hypothetical protein